jgi:hypothetical protein
MQKRAPRGFGVLHRVHVSVGEGTATLRSEGGEGATSGSGSAPRLAKDTDGAVGRARAGGAAGGLVAATGAAAVAASGDVDGGPPADE